MFKLPSFSVIGNIIRKIYIFFPFLKIDIKGVFYYLDWTL